MLARLTSGLALASMVALVLVGCTPPEPSAEELGAEARETFAGFYETVDEQMAAGTVDSADFEEYATPELSEQWAQDVQAVIDAGTVSRGVLTIVDLEIVDYAVDRVDARICTDGRDIVTTYADGSTQEPSGLISWSASFVRGDDTTLRLATLDPSQDQTVCE